MDDKTYTPKDLGIALTAEGKALLYYQRTSQTPLLIRELIDAAMDNAIVGFCLTGILNRRVDYAWTGFVRLGFDVAQGHLLVPGTQLRLPLSAFGTQMTEAAVLLVGMNTDDQQLPVEQREKGYLVFFPARRAS
ncbi:MAG: hypothetical protein GX565_01115 [Lentisphaerae bacterium]|nr:hypothetical protein [Lentisphaerota bacterium]